MTTYAVIKLPSSIAAHNLERPAPARIFMQVLNIGSSIRPVSSKKISGNIVEYLPITRWIVAATKVSDGSFAGMVDTGEGATTYTLYVNTPDLCNLTIYPKIDGNWRKGRRSLLGEYIVASNPDSVQFIFKVTTAGIFDATTESTWNTTIGATTTQGTAVLTCVAANVTPVSLGTKIPI